MEILSDKKNCSYFNNSNMMMLHSISSFTEDAFVVCHIVLLLIYSFSFDFYLFFGADTVHGIVRWKCVNALQFVFGKHTSCLLYIGKCFLFSVFQFIFITFVCWTLFFMFMVKCFYDNKFVGSFNKNKFGENGFLINKECIHNKELIQLKNKRQTTFILLHV